MHFIVTQCTKNGPPNNNYKNNLYFQTKCVNYAQISNIMPNNTLIVCRQAMRQQPTNHVSYTRSEICLRILIFLTALVQFRHNTPKQKERKNKTKQNNVDDGFCFFFFFLGGGVPKKKAETIIHRKELQQEAQYTAHLTAKLSKSSQRNINKSTSHRTCKQPAQTAKTHTQSKMC